MPHNHYRSKEDHAFVIEKYSKEIALGRVSPGFEPDVAFRLFGPFRSAPLNVILSAGGKRRITLDLSYPRNNLDIPSINSLIDPSQFQCDWGTFSTCWLLVADSPPGTQVAVFDMDSAFCNVPTNPDDWLLLTVVIDGLVHFDFQLNFGVSSAPGIFGSLADAIVKIFLCYGIEAVLKWVDDFIFFRYPRSQSLPYSYNYDENLIWSIADRLGWPWAKDKHFPFLSSFRYIGFAWNLESKMVELLENKRIKYLNKLSDWVQGGRVSLKTTESLIGTLNHVCLVVPTG